MSERRLVAICLFVIVLCAMLAGAWLSVEIAQGGGIVGVVR